MAYTKNVYVDGQIIDANRLNHTEQGIYENSQKVDTLTTEQANIIAALAPEYSANETYSVGQYAWHDGVLYKSKIAITTAESFTAAHWETVALADDVNKLKNALISSNMDFVTTIARNTDLDSFITPGAYRIGSDSAASEISNVPVSKAARVIVSYLTSGTLILQIYITNTAKFYARIKVGGTWSVWVKLTDDSDQNVYFAKGRLVSYPVDLDTVTDIGTYAIMANDPPTRYQNCPSDAGGELVVIKSFSNYITQIFYSNDGNFYIRRYTSSWSAWNKFTSDSVISEETYSKNLLGIFRTIGVVGDSLASGQGRVNDLNHYHDFYEYSWPQQLKRQLGNEIYNFTESSLSTRTWLTDEDHGWALASDGNHACQCYIIGLGANDVALAVADSSYIGSQSDVHVSDYTQNPDTYYGNYARIISMLKTLEPRAVIFTLTNPAFGSSDEIRNQLNTAVAYMETVFDNVYNIELDAELFTSGYILANKVKAHYTPAAYLYIANYLNKAMSKVIYDNPSDFFFANLIGTEYATPVIS